MFPHIIRSELIKRSGRTERGSRPRLETLEVRCVPSNLVTNGSFETPQEPSIGVEIRAPANIGGWILDRNSVDLVTNYQTAQGRQFLFLSGGNAGSIYQD